jgi:large subunit ribosomal protein L11
MAQRINVLVDAGKASAGPPLGPALGPLGVNVTEVIAKINEKTKDFAGMKVPVEVSVDPSTKKFEVKTGSPPVSQLIMKEIGAEKLASNPKFEKVGNLGIEQVIKIAKMKLDSLNCLAMKSAVKTIIGTCVSIGVIVEGMEPRDATKAVNDGRFDKEIKAESTTISPEKKKVLAQQLVDKKAALEKILRELKALEEAEKPTEAAVEAAPAEGAAPAAGKAAAPAAAGKAAAPAAAGKGAAPAAAGKAAAPAAAGKAPAKEEKKK